MTRALACLYLLLFSYMLSAQDNCRQQEYQRQLLLLHPQLHSQFQKIEEFTIRHPFHISSGTTVLDTAIRQPVPQKIIIPVVVHVLWATNVQNLPLARILSQLEVMNN